ncbi:transposase [Mammaliicoccus lentus]|uniref:Transposase n=1 Tax=Mammaliicoccus lentus TaxID=42858 RepID=A0AAX3W4K9_MAMLE|nr:transposase [Mammaliicoccus lentus]WHI59856.1 transposase [Mammaliicoccus lentus]
MNKKYSLKFKLKLVKRYREGTNSATSIAREFSIGRSLLFCWNYQFEYFGEAGLSPNKISRYYTDEEKLHILRYRKKYQLSYRETAIHFKIINYYLISQWQSKFDKCGILGINNMRESERLPMNRKNKNKKLNDSERAELEYLREQNKRYEILMAYEKS